MNTSDWIDERIASDPKGTIKSLLDQTKRQAKTIHERDKEIEKLKKEIEKFKST